MSRSALEVSQSEYANEGLKYANEVYVHLQEQSTLIILCMDNTVIHCYPPTKFCHCSPYSPLDIYFFVISQSEQICKWDIYNAHSVTTDPVGITLAHHYPHTKFGHCHDCSLWNSGYLPFLLLADQPLHWIICLSSSSHPLSNLWMHSVLNLDYIRGGGVPTFILVCVGVPKDWK